MSDHASGPESCGVPDGLPSISGSDEDINSATTDRPAALPGDDVNINMVQSAFALALHMHQPMIPAGAEELHVAPLISNVQHMLGRERESERRRAEHYLECYGRIAELIRGALAAGGRPRIMLDYSGTLLWGLEQMGRVDVLARLRKLTMEDPGRRCIEWLGTTWGHAVAGSTPAADLVLQMRAWQHHFASLFGLEALSRVRGFSPPEMNLPNHPDQAYAFVGALRECGYHWLLVQRDSVEQLDGSAVECPYLPHKLVARNLAGDSVSITALVKTRASDNTLIAAMQPIAEAHTQRRVRLGGRMVPALVAQIGDGENGPEIVHEFPRAFINAFANLAGPHVVALNGSEYLGLLEAAGVEPNAYPAVQPVHQHRLWERLNEQDEPDLQAVVRALKKEDARFRLDGASWDFRRSWVKGYAALLRRMNRLSGRFHEVLDDADVDRGSHAYRNALLHLLLSQTSCFRYWGRGRWTRYGEEICRRAEDILRYDFGSGGGARRVRSK
ncbi:MAG: hypothetical protein JSU68_05580 [Phycisphaerales bacterium]|nr:MAG: hypothetical protein JSU68_05580 [Phycisphaerales bacterium]